MFVTLLFGRHQLRSGDKGMPDIRMYDPYGSWKVICLEQSCCHMCTCMLLVQGQGIMKKFDTLATLQCEQFISLTYVHVRMALW